MLGFIIGAIRNCIVRARARRELRRVQRENVRNKGVVDYHDAPIEAFVRRDTAENVVVSGNNKAVNDRVSCAAAYNAFKLGAPVVVLHCGNSQLESLLRQAFMGERGFHVVNDTHRCYEPFLGLNKNRIAELVLSSAPEACRINYVGGSYIRGLTDYLLVRSRVPCARSYISCPHDDLESTIDDNEARGVISSTDANRIRDQLKKGLSERGNVEQYFRVLNRQADCILADKDMLARGEAVSIHEAVKNNEVIVIDIVDSSNELLLNLLTQEFNDEMAAGRSFTVVLDGVPVDASESLGRLLRNFSGRCRFVYAAEDVYVGATSNETVFNTILGRADSVFVSRHTSGASSKRLSEYFGQYRKLEIVHTAAMGQQYATYDQIFPGSNNVSNVVYQPMDRPRVEEPEVMGLGYDTLFIKQSHGNEIARVRVTEGEARGTYAEPRRRVSLGDAIGEISWFVFVVLLLLCSPIAFAYAFFKARGRARIVFAVLFVLSIPFVVGMYHVNLYGANTYNS